MVIQPKPHPVVVIGVTWRTEDDGSTGVPLTPEEQEDADEIVEWAERALVVAPGPTGSHRPELYALAPDPARPGVDFWRMDCTRAGCALDVRFESDDTRGIVRTREVGVGVACAEPGRRRRMVP